MRRRYVAAMHGLRHVLTSVGVVGMLERRAPRSRIALWLRSLLAIHDVHDLAVLDVPWWTFAAQREVAAHLRSRPGAVVLEWGSGASTLWLSRRAAEVTSIEHDADWWRRMRDLVDPQVRLLLVEPVPAASDDAVRSQRRGCRDLDFADYVAAPAAGARYDLVVIDGRAREACLRRALDLLAPGAMIVFDNVERRRYRRAIRAAGLTPRMSASWGLTPCLPYPTRTALIRDQP